MQESAAENDVLADGTPVRLGRYRLLRPISTGGMARVFEARRESLAGVSPRVAIKVILAEYAKHDGFQRLFINEARIGSLLAHQNLVQIQDFDHQDERYYLVMEYVEGVTLRRVISMCRRHGVPVPLHIIAEIGRQVCDGLGYAHSARAEDGSLLHLVHRDIKPSNLIVNPQGVVKLLDFGISKALVTGERKGAVRGTWGYMGPEQANGLEIGPSSDLFGLASVLYELAALQPLFPEKEPDEIRNLMARDEGARRATALTGPLSPLSGVLVRALQRDPAARFVTAASMGRALGALIEDPVTARDRLVRFQQEMTARAAATVTESRRQLRNSSTMSPTGASQASAGPSSGLPVVVGSPHQARVPTRRVPVQATTPSSVGRMVATVLFTAGAVGIVAFTGWKLFGQDTAPVPLNAPAPTEQPGPLSQLAGEGAATTEQPAADLVQPSPSPPETAPVQAPTVIPVPAPAPVQAAQVAPPVPPAPVVVDDPPPTGSTDGVDPGTSAEEASDAPAAAEPAADSTPQAGMVSVRLSSDPRATVIVDKVPRGQTPLMALALDPGRHAVTLQTTDGRRSTFTIDVAEGQKNVWVYDFESRSFR